MKITTCLWRKNKTLAISIILFRSKVKTPREVGFLLYYPI